MNEEKKVPAIRFKGFTDDWEQRKLGNSGSFKNAHQESPRFVDRRVIARVLNMRMLLQRKGA